MPVLVLLAVVAIAHASDESVTWTPNDTGEFPVGSTEWEGDVLWEYVGMATYFVGNVDWDEGIPFHDNSFPNGFDVPAFPSSYCGGPKAAQFRAFVIANVPGF